MSFNKKAGLGEDINLEVVLFVILNIVFFSALFYFVQSAGNSALAYEQVYAKTIASSINNAKPDTVILFDLKNIKKIIGGANLNMNKIFLIDDDKNLVVVRLGKGAGYEYRYFSDFKIASEISKEQLKLTITKK